MNKFAIAAAKSPTSKDEVELLLLTLFFDNPNSEISGGQSSLRFVLSIFVIFAFQLSRVRLIVPSCHSEWEDLEVLRGNNS